MTRSEYRRLHQAARVKRFRRLHKCTVCGAKRVRGSMMCLKHLEAARVRARVRIGAKEWRVGGPGRPPVGVVHG